MHLIFISRRIITEKIPEHVPPCKRDSQYCPAPRLFSLAVSHLLTSSSAVAFTKKKNRNGEAWQRKKKAVRLRTLECAGQKIFLPPFQRVNNTESLESQVNSFQTTFCIYIINRA